MSGTCVHEHDLCALSFCFLLLSHVPSDRISLPGPSASNVLKIDFSVALAIGSLYSKLCLTQLKLSELLGGLLQPQDLSYSR